MKQAALIALILITTAVLGMAREKPQVDGDFLWKRITALSPYMQWDQFPGHQGMQSGRAPHGPLHKVYVNRPGLRPGHPKPDGAIIVKENYTADQRLAAVTVMYKVKGYNPGAGDWFWAKYAPDGTVQKQGKPAGCINCHMTRARQDFIMVSDY